VNRPGENGEPVGARLVPRDQKSPTTLVDAIREQALDGEFDPPPSPQSEEAGRGSRSCLKPADEVLEGAKRVTRMRSGYRMRLVPLVLLALAALGGAIALVIAPIYLDLFRRELSRADELEQVARGLGLQFSRTDPAYPGSTAFHHPFELFSRGLEETCENFITGTIAGVDVVAFDFLYQHRTESDAPLHNDVRSEPVRYSCALARVEGERPHVVIEPRWHLWTLAPTASRCVWNGATSTRAIA
jgi:hypothetical protein